MKLSIFTTVTKPDKRGDAYKEAIKCYKDLADEVVIIYGHDINYGFTGIGGENVVHVPSLITSWPKDFSWELIGEHFQRGYEDCTGDWVIHADLDFIFHESDFGKIRQALKDYPNSPAVSFYKWQFIQPDRYNLKSRLVLAVNKAKFGDRIKFNGGGDLCQPTLDGQELNLNEVPQSGVPFYNYEKLTKTKEQVIDDVERMDRAYHRKFGKWLYSDEGINAYKGWLEMVIGRFQKPQAFIELHQHPKYIQDTIINLSPDQFGFNAFGELGVNRYAQNLMRG